MSILRIATALRSPWSNGRFRRDQSGLAALEFALILPIMVVLYLGGFEVSEAFMINRKVTHATSVLGDLVAQAEEITDDQMDNILDAVTAVMNPYPIDDMEIVVSGITVDGEGVATVAWSDSRNMSAYSAGTAYDLPGDINQPDTFLIAAEVRYQYTPRFGEALTGAFDLHDEFYLRPRLQNEVERN